MSNGETFGGAAADTAQDFATKVKDAAEQAKGAGSDIADKAKAKLGDLHGQAMDATADFRGQAMKYKDQALDQARSAAEDGKMKAADTIHGVADDLREAATSLGRNQTIAPVGKYANQAADALEDFAGTLRDKDIDQLVTEASGFVRRNPAIAIGIAVAAGFALTQILRGGSSASSSNYDRYDS